MRFSAKRPMRARLLRCADRRKGVHILLEAWHKLSLPHAQLTLVGTVYEEIRPTLDAIREPSIR